MKVRELKMMLESVPDDMQVDLDAVAIDPGDEPATVFVITLP